MAYERRHERMGEGDTGDTIGAAIASGSASTEVPAPPPAATGRRSGPRVVLAHDYLLVMRGAERVFAAIADLYPRAPILTLLYDEPGTGGRFAGHDVTTSRLQRLGVRQSSFRRLLPLYPRAVERLRPPPCDVLISSSSAFAHGVRAPRGTPHLCYCHAPFRYVWNERERALAEVPAPLRPLLALELRRIRAWDLAASRRVDRYLANSRLTRDRLRRYYGREAEIVHPPVETHRFATGEPGEALLVVCELVDHKRVNVALEAARRTGTPIQVVGTGPEYAALREAYPEADFLGRVGDEELARLYASARAVLVTSVEEFGITAVEAQAAGRPVIAAGAGGALETVLEGQTGLYARFDDVDSFARAISALERMPLDPTVAVANAARFSVESFQRRIREQVDALVDVRG
ncbi:MAG TPA: glycosyltransferase [Solirubrobacteraceae bacterium]|nr:glycosyltransferase [Solirubrobacteraceae bacterium]